MKSKRENMKRGPHDDLEQRSRPDWLWMLSAILVLSLVWGVLQAKAGGDTTRVRWQGWSTWALGWERSAYCSESNPTFRVWRVQLGPVEVTHTRLARSRDPNP